MAEYEQAYTKSSRHDVIFLVLLWGWYYARRGCTQTTLYGLQMRRMLLFDSISIFFIRYSSLTYSYLYFVHNMYICYWIWKSLSSCPLLRDSRRCYYRLAVEMFETKLIFASSCFCIIANSVDPLCFLRIFFL